VCDEGDMPSNMNIDAGEVLPCAPVTLVNAPDVMRLRHTSEATHDQRRRTSSCKTGSRVSAPPKKSAPGKILSLPPHHHCPHHPPLHHHHHPLRRRLLLPHLTPHLLHLPLHLLHPLQRLRRRRRGCSTVLWGWDLLLCETRTACRSASASASFLPGVRRREADAFPSVIRWCRSTV